MPGEITESNREDIALTAEAVHQISHRLTGIERMLGELLTAWRQHAPVLEAFQRGGVLAARTAARNGRRHPPQEPQ